MVHNGQIHEHPIVQAANVALESTAKTLTWMLTPPLLKPLVWPVVSLCPPSAIRTLNIARMQLYTAALTLARNAMERIGAPWNDELRVTQAFGEYGQRACHLLGWRPAVPPAAQTSMRTCANALKMLTTVSAGEAET